MLPFSLYYKLPLFILMKFEQCHGNELIPPCVVDAFFSKTYAKKSLTNNMRSTNVEHLTEHRIGNSPQDNHKNERVWNSDGNLRINSCSAVAYRESKLSQKLVVQKRFWQIWEIIEFAKNFSLEPTLLFTVLPPFLPTEIISVKFYIILWICSILNENIGSYMWICSCLS